MSEVGIEIIKINLTELIGVSIAPRRDEYSTETEDLSQKTIESIWKQKNSKASKQKSKWSGSKAKLNKWKFLKILPTAWQMAHQRYEDARLKGSCNKAL